MPSVDTFYKAKRANPLGNATAETTFKTADDATKPAVCYLKSSGALDGQGFRAVVRGVVVAGAAGNLTVNIRQGTTVAGVLLASTGAVAIAGAGTFNFEIVFEGVWDADSDRIRGRMFGHVADTAVAEVINSTAVTGIDANTSDNLPLVASGLFSVSNVGNDLRIKEFVTETV